MDRLPSEDLELLLDFGGCLVIPRKLKIKNYLKKIFEKMKIFLFVHLVLKLWTQVTKSD
jgi:hypothetical protein